MTDIVEAPAPVARRPGTTRRRTVVGVGVLLLICGSLAAVWWWTHPSLFDAPGNKVGFDRATVGTPVSVGITYPGVPEGVEDVTVTDVEANLAQDTSGSTIAFSVCAAGSRDVIGLVEGTPEDLCLDARPAADVRLTSGDYLLMTVTPAQPGVVDVTSFDISYRYGSHRLWQHGTDTTGTRVTVTTP
ncbi:hypothetical protein ASC77_03885 [Nocardioides sp. Root1257]|uniref:hypothetical protein n=1 Tax=unclassified Nocardioides TaxID=2615069 RepID=UPI0006FB789B|nr:MULTISPECIES: hypothetical protein [unclassified Nocardioides]KQW53433.1 hypothetical protein ASC77_03885 [Nocardioides sp. Root1257]KRC56119.1 hypothetical protein ASE24_03885 [Nocardioides sp. Root224]